MVRPKKIIEEVVKTIDNEVKTPIMSVVYDTVDKKIVLIDNEKITSRYKHI